MLNGAILSKSKEMEEAVRGFYSNGKFVLPNFQPKLAPAIEWVSINTLISDNHDINNLCYCWGNIKKLVLTILNI